MLALSFVFIQKRGLECFEPFRSRPQVSACPTRIVQIGEAKSIFTLLVFTEEGVKVLLPSKSINLLHKRFVPLRYYVWFRQPFRKSYKRPQSIKVTKAFCVF